MSRTRQQLAMFVFSHLFTSLFDDTAQLITSSHGILLLFVLFGRLHTTFGNRLSTAFWIG
jgi:hypothetical protein